MESGRIACLRPFSLRTMLCVRLQASLNGQLFEMDYYKVGRSKYGVTLV
jgi:hypothetical protein